MSSASASSTASASNFEDSLIEELKKSLKITENEFLESEIEDLKEFFTVELTESPQDGCELDNQAFWLKVALPINLRSISKEGKEILKDEIPEISIKIKLKTGKFAVQMAVEHNEPVNECEEVVNEPKTTAEDSSNEQTMNLIVESITQTINTETVCEQVKAPLPYEFVEFKVETIEDPENETKLKSILKELLEEKEISLLTAIEEFYMKLEDANYPHKTVICRDYYYPVFDCRHWGRFATSSKSSNSSHSSTSGSSLNDPTGSNSISYRARALYDFQALMQGELSFQENEVLIVLANLGNGWLTARRSSTCKDTEPANSVNEDTNTGLIPENYIERL